jgi:hypothetical protein
MNSRRGSLCLVTLLLGIGFFLPSRARAAGIILITHGKTVNHVADIPAPHHAFIQKETGPGVAIGYSYSYWGIFWLDFWTWGGEYCLYRDKTVWKVPPEFLAQITGKSSVDELGKPFPYKFPLGLVILVGIVALSVPASIVRKAPERKLRRLFADPRYQKALDIIRERISKAQAVAAAPAQEGAAAPAPPAADKAPVDLGFDEAVNYLVSEGIDRPHAIRNLTMMVHVIAQAQAQEEVESPAPPEEGEAPRPAQPGG